MNTLNIGPLGRRPLLLILLSLLAACFNGNNDPAYFRADSLKVTSFNLGLALNCVPFTNERLMVTGGGLHPSHR